jgi:hypothetical protein
MNFASYFLYFKFVLVNGSVRKESGTSTCAYVPNHVHVEGGQQGPLVQAPAPRGPNIYSFLILNKS